MPLEVNILALVLFLSAVLGDSCNYMIGHFFGNKLFNNPDSRIFKQSHLEKTHEFYKKYGGKTIIIARFVPIVRTFAPFVAGMGKMHYYYFMVYNLIGGALWVGIFCYAGYFFGDLPFVQKKYGGKTIIIARFVPIVRTFAPFVAGMGKMHYYYFMVYNLIGGALWVGIFCYAGYFFGDLPFVQKNLKLLIVAIIVVSILPAVIEVGRNKWKTRHY